MIGEKKFYLTKEGLERIKKEYQSLKDLKLTKTRDDFPQSWHSEDLNPEYLSLQEDLSFLESRIAELEYIIKNAVLIISPPKNKQNIIALGATVLVEVDGQKDEFTIVSSLEANPAMGKISIESPVGKTLLGRKVGEVVTVQSSVPIIYKILKIKYRSDCG